MGTLGDIATILGLGIVGYVIYMFGTGQWKFPEIKFPELKLPEFKFEFGGIGDLLGGVLAPIGGISYGGLPPIQPIPIAPFVAAVPHEPAKDVLAGLARIEPMAAPIGETQAKLLAWSAWLAQQVAPPHEELYFSFGGFTIPIGERIAPGYQPQPPPPLPKIVASGIPAYQVSVYTGTKAQYDALPREIKQYYAPPAG